MATKCKNCGAENNDLAMFCRKCGRNLATGDEINRVPVKEQSTRRRVVHGGIASDLPSMPAPLKPDFRCLVASASARRLVAFLVTYSHGPSGRFVPLFEGRVRIGSDPGECDILIDGEDDPAVTGVHVLILYRRGTLSLRDQDSVNGTWVDDETVSRGLCPDLYDGERQPERKTIEFDGESVTLVNVDDERILLRDHSRFMIGNTLFEVMLIGARLGHQRSVEGR